MSKPPLIARFGMAMMGVIVMVGLFVALALNSSGGLPFWPWFAISVVALIVAVVMMVGAFADLM